MNGNYLRTIVKICSVVTPLISVCTTAQEVAETTPPSSSQAEEVVASSKPVVLGGTAPDSNKFRFAIVADRTGGMRSGVFEKAIGKLNMMKPDFVMSVGDLIEGYSTDLTKVGPEWDQLNEILGDLHAPFYYVTGNHDLSNNAMAKAYGQRYGRPYYHFVHDNVLFLALCTEDPDGRPFSDAQIAYVNKALAENSKVDWTFLFMHKPVWEPSNRANAKWRKIADALDDRPFTVFSGHYHSYFKSTIDGRDYYRLSTTGGGSDLEGPGAGYFDHITWVTMTDQGPQVANLALDGIVPDNVVDAVSKEWTDRLFGGAIKLGPITLESDTFQALEIPFLVDNSGLPGPMTVTCRTAVNSPLRIEPPSFSLTIPAGAMTSTPIRVSADAPVRVGVPDPIQLNCQISLTPTNRYPIQINTLLERLIVDTNTCLPCPAREKPLVIDGKTGDWDALPYECRVPAHVDEVPETWSGEKDCRFALGLSHDDQYVYFAVNVVDPQLVVDPNGRPRDQDGIEIIVDPDPPVTEGKYKTALCVDVSPTTDGQPLLETRNIPVEEVKTACIRTTDGMSAEVAIPRSRIPAVWGNRNEPFTINVMVSDLDPGDGACARLWWRPSWYRPRFKDQAYMSTFRLR